MESKQKLTPTKAHGSIPARCDLDDFFPYISTLVGVLSEMIFPEPIYVLIFRGDGFPCGSCSWVPTTITFAGHMAKARTPRYTWTLDLALCRESNGDVLGALLHGTLSKIQKIIDTGYGVLRKYYIGARVIIGGDSPWLRHLLGVSTYFGVGSGYSFATWCRELQRWCDTDVPRTTTAKQKKRTVYTGAATAWDARGCTKEPLLHIDDRHHFVVMCVLHLLIAMGKYVTKFLRVHATRLTPHQRNKAQEGLNKAKTNIAMKGKSQPDGEELWRLLTNWSVIAKVMKLPSQARAVVEQMSVLLTQMYCWEFHPEVLKCAGVAKRFQLIICPTVRSPYLLWLRKDAKMVFTSIHS